MNKNFRLIANRLGCFFEEKPEGLKITFPAHMPAGDTLNKLLEQIVIECANISETADPHNTRTVILQHFGINNSQQHLPGYPLNSNVD